MPANLTLACSQSRTLPTTALTLSALARTTRTAASAGVDILLFPEAYLGGYPRTCDFGASVGSRSDVGKEQFLQYFHSAVDLGDTPAGAGSAWVDRKLEIARGKEVRGDGTKEELEAIARETGVFLVVGVVERAGGSLYCACVYVCPKLGCIGKRRKVMPTGTERLVWAQGQTETLRAVVTDIKGVRVCLAAAICWENYMPLLRMSLYSQNVNLYLAPTADGRENWLSLMRTVAGEGRCYVISANQCLRRRHLPGWITGKKGESAVEGEEFDGESERLGGVERDRKQRRKSIRTKTEDGHEIVFPSCGQKNGGLADAQDSGTAPNGTSPLRFGKVSADDETVEWKEPHESAPEKHLLALPSTDQKVSSSFTNEDDGDDKFVSRGGSCIIGATGDILAGPLWEVDEGGLLIATVDFEDCERGRLDLDVAGSYGRLDSFELKVKGLDLSPPP